MVYNLYELKDDEKFNNCEGCSNPLRVVQLGRKSAEEDIPTMLVCINVDCRMFKVVVVGEFQ